MLIHPRLWRSALFGGMNFGLKLLHLLLLVRVGHAAFPFGSLVLVLKGGGVRVNNEDDFLKSLIKSIFFEQ